MFEGPRDRVFEAEGKEAMVFQAKKWGWKRIAVRLLLVPVLAGGSAGTVQAQMQTTTGGATTQTQMAGKGMNAPVDPKALLKAGRKALAEDRFNEARDLAQRAESSNPTGKWGLFDDTPNSLRQDIDTAQAKAKKAQAEQLTKKAKELFAKPTRSDAERAANLANALQMAKRADHLHGPYSVWDFGDRPDKLAKEIEAARSKLPPVPMPPTGSNTAIRNPASVGGQNPGVRTAVGANSLDGTSGVVSGAGPGMPGGAIPVSSARQTGPVAPGAMPPSVMAAASATPVAPTAPATVDPKKTAALKLMAEGRQLADRGDFPGARAKYLEAAKIGAMFSEREYSPGFALQELNTRGAAAIDRLVKESQTQMGQRDYARAEAALNAASEIAASLSLFPRPIEEAKTALRMASGGKNGGVPPGGLAPAGGPETLVSVSSRPAAPSGLPGVGVIASPTLPTAPSGPTGIAVSSPTAPAMPVAQAGSSATGRQLFDQATAAYSAGDFETAKRLAMQAHNSGGLQIESQALLNQIDAEVFASKQRTATKSFEAAVAAAQNKEHEHALQVLVLIDPNYLSAEQKAKREGLITSCKVELDRVSASQSSGGFVAAAGMQPPTGGGQLQPGLGMPPVGVNPPGTARVGGDPKVDNPDSLTGQVEAMRRVTFQKLRGEGLKVQADAQAAFGRGETDPAIQMLLDYENRVRAANLEAGSVAILLRPIDSRLEMFRVMKGQADALSREKNDRREAKLLVSQRGAADEQRKAEVQKLVRQYNDLAKQSKFAEAERVALQAKQLEPDDPAITGLALVAKMRKRQNDYQQIKENKEKMVLGGLNDAEKEGPLVTNDDPVSIRIESSLRARRRGSLDDVYLHSRTPEEYRIETKLDQPISLEFNQTPLSEAVENIRTMTGLPISYDTASLTAAGISTALPISEKLPSISTRNALNLILDKAGLSFVIEYGTVRITTIKMVKGRMFTKVFSVADLVTPVPNFALPDYANFDKMFNRNALNNPQAVISGLNAPSSVGGKNGLGFSGQTQQASPGISGGFQLGQGGGTLQNEGPTNPLGSSANLAPGNTKHEQLIRLITSMVRPFSWEAGPAGGPGKIEYFDLGSALVVNQTADVIREVQDLLEALRRLQDLAVSVEVRIISLSESFFERMGVDFSMNINSTGKNNIQFQPQLTTGQFTPEPFINSIQNKGVITGLTPAGTFTPDLAVPIQSSSFQYAIPGYGGYPNNPGANGGVSLGLAFLNDIQVYLFMEAAQGDRRTNVMQAPKITLFNGQTATLAANYSSFAVTNVQVYSVNGQVVFVPQNTLLPSSGPINPLGNGTPAGTTPSINMSLQAVVSADRRFVRINIPITLGVETGTTIPLFPVTTFIIPVFEGGSQGVPVPFTQFLQQPSFTTLNISTTVVCPDGGTVLLGGVKQLAESRNEFGPPFLSKIPYLDRLFKNVGIGRDTSHIMIMITPRIIINAEEEIIQTEGSGPLGTRPGGP